MFKYYLSTLLYMLHLISKSKYEKIVWKYDFTKTQHYRALANSDFFDAEWYLEQNPDVKRSGIDPVWHYLMFGWKEGREPSLFFCGNKYLETYSDVAKAKVCPLLHYLLFGKKEHRRICNYTTSVASSEQPFAFKAFSLLQQKEKQNIKNKILDIDSIKKYIANPSVKVVSFDIFDTLLIRPVIHPTDIFYLVDAKLKKENGLDFIKYRLKAEEDLQNPYASLDAIYAGIQKKHSLSKKIINLMEKEELACEKQLLRARKDVYSLYMYAVSLKKRIIAVSDMYLPSSFLHQVLKQNGYDKIAAVYVSNEYQKRKDTGALYDAVLGKEHLLPSQLLHIGDNYHSDFLCAIDKNIFSVYYPSIKDIVFSSNSVYSKVWGKEVSNDPFSRMLLGFSLNHYFSDLTAVKNQPACFSDIKALAKLGLAPLLFCIVSRIANNSEIQQKYQKILFASRDGYLPQLCYQIMSDFLPVLPSQYIYAGRRAYFTSIYSDIKEYLSELCVCGERPFLLKHLVESCIFDKKLCHRIISSLSKEEQSIDLRHTPQAVLPVLSKFEKDIHKYWKKHKKEAYRYYTSVRSKFPREIIFDCGYSGSISRSLSKIMGKPVDKIYLWETDKNKKMDLQNQTKTYVLMETPLLFPGNDQLYEELFSPCEGGCIGFNNLKPCFEDFPKNKQMATDCLTIKKNVEAYMKAACSLFKPYLPYMNIKDSLPQQQLFSYMVRSPYNEINLLKNISFPDPTVYSESISLSQKLQERQNYNSVLDGTGFYNPIYLTESPAVLCKNQLKIGIHCHLYNVFLYQEIYNYLKDFPQPFDLILTVCDSSKVNLLEKVFSSISNLKKLDIRVVPNRGRDVAPWLVSTRELQNQYDLFCHIHGKVSKHMNFGNRWREYLLENLISSRAAVNIINIFCRRKEVGCVFPFIFPELAKLCVNGNINMSGMDGEEKMIQMICRKMRLPFPSRSTLLHSCGTMLWYRPVALKPLFDLNWKVEDFPPEPIGVGGTIAHALERVPVWVCQAQGYEPCVFNER